MGRIWKIHVSNYRDAGTVTEIPSCLKSGIMENVTCLKSGMNKIASQRQAFSSNEIQTLASYPGLLAPGSITCKKACFFALLGGHSSIAEHIWFKNSRNE